MNTCESVNLTFYNFQVYVNGRQLDFCDSFTEKDFRIKSVMRSPVFGWLAAYPGRGREVHR